MTYEEFAARTPRSAKRFWYGVAESFFRRWPLYVLPLLLFVAIGVMQARNVSAEYRSQGVLNVASNPLLNDVTPLGSSGAYGFETPSAATTRMVNELLRTDLFVTSVAESAGLKSALDSGFVSLAQVRARVYARSTGDRLLTVAASWTDPITATQLVNAVIEEYQKHVVDVGSKQSSDAEKFWTNLKKSYEASYEAAQAAYQAYIVANPPPKVGERPTEQTLELQTLNTAITLAQNQMASADSKIEEARLATQQAAGQTGQGLQIIDPPKTPTAPDPIRRKQALTIAVFLFLGLFIVIGMLLLSSVLDRAVRSADDIDRVAGLSVVATVPTIAELNRRDKKRKRKHERAPANV